MPAEAAKFAPLRFSTREFPERERMLRLREEFGQSMLHVDIRPLSEVPFSSRSDIAAADRSAHAFVEGLAYALGARANQSCR